MLSLEIWMIEKSTIAHWYTSIFICVYFLCSAWNTHYIINDKIFTWMKLFCSSHIKIDPHNSQVSCVKLHHFTFITMSLFVKSCTPVNIFTMYMYNSLFKHFYILPHNTVTIRFKGLLRRYAYPSTKYGVRVQ